MGDVQQGIALALRLQGPAGVGPLERLGQDVVEVADERNKAVAEFIERREAASLEKPPGQNRKPDLHLIEPGAVPRRVDEANPMRCISQEPLASPLRLEDAATPLDAEFDVDAAAPGDQANQSFGHVRVELVSDEYPASVRVGIDRRFNVSDEIYFGAGRADRRFADAPLGDVPVCHQAQRAVPDVFELDKLVLPWSRWLRRMLTFQRLNTGFFVAANDVRPLGFELRSRKVRVAQCSYLLVVLLGVFLLVRRRQPVAALMRPELCFFLKSDQPGAVRCS